MEPANAFQTITPWQGHSDPLPSPAQETPVIPATPIYSTSIMNDAARLVDPTAITGAFSAQLAFISSNPPQTGALVYLLPPCLVLIAIDVAARLRRLTLKPSTEETAPSVREVEMHHVIARVHEVLIKFQRLESKLSTKQARSQHLARMLQKQKNFALHRQRLIAYNANAQVDESHKVGPAKRASKRGNDSKKHFEAFCQRLLLQNKIWAQQREIQDLQKKLDARKKDSAANAFQTFCDRLVLSNNIWKQQKEIDRLMGEVEQLKHSKGIAVTRAAKKMVIEVEKERLTEDFVRDLIVEVEECRQAVVTLRSEHEREVQELAEDWRQQCRKLSKQVERLELARDAHLVEQGLSNDQENRLVERLALAESKAAALDEQLAGPAELDYSIQEETDDTMSISDSLERMSNTSTSTCVGSGADRSPNRKTSFGEIPAEKRPVLDRRATLPSLSTHSRRQSLTYIAVSPTSAKSASRALDPGPYAGFSFNPLFFGPGNGPQTEDETEGESSIKRYRTSSLKSTHSLDSRKSGRGSSLSMRSTTLSTTSEMQQPKRAQWRL